MIDGSHATRQGESLEQKWHRVYSEQFAVPDTPETLPFKKFTGYDEYPDVIVSSSTEETDCAELA